MSAFIGAKESEMLKTKEVVEMKQRFEEITSQKAPGFNHDTFSSVEDYKGYLQKADLSIELIPWWEDPEVIVAIEKAVADSKLK